jgi:nucleotide-binding universal stress UspA family protein
MLEMSVAEAKEALDARVSTLRDEGFEASAHVFRGDPADVIATSARESKVDMIILATHGKSGTKAFWSGSVANKVCSQCKVPLLLIPIRKEG